ncbi:MAG TPA: nuclear transport factor 2 family protein [Allosphingosinicella sp.]|jgi:ketosteroid isomerase-like protein|nr:nuclear transport factor 2 family protein [Allosphingosinicella sp.]
MKTHQLTRNDLSEEGFGWYRSYLTSLDAKDLEAYGAFLAEDCVIFMNNDGPIAGKQAILGMLGPYWQSFGALEHDLLTILGDDRHFMLEALNHYGRLDGSRVTLRAVAITERGEDGLVKSARIYSDASPLFAKGGETG